MFRILTRGIALFFGLFAACNALANLVRPGLGGNGWWIELPCMHPFAQDLLLFSSGILLFLYGLFPSMTRGRRSLTACVAACLAGASAWNAGQVWMLAYRGRIEMGFPVPFSIPVTAALAGVFWASLRNSTRPKARCEAGYVVLAALGVAVLFPLAQMFCYGKTDYRRHADVAVVLGARAYADGSPSQALYDRVQTAADLYKGGFVSRLILSGGPGDGPWHETDVMRRLAVDMGVPDGCILADREGMNTSATTQHTAELFSKLNATKVLVVSHAYHLPRVKLSYQRLGIQVYTVPARESHLLSQLPRFMAREVAALWYYWLGLARA